MLSLRRTRVGTVLLLGLLCLCAAPALALQKPPKDKDKKDPPKKEAAAPVRLEPFLGTYSDAKALAKERNVPLIVHIVLEGEQANDQYREKVLPNKELVAASANAVVIVANNGTHPKKSVEEPQPDGTKVRKELCSLYSTPNCGAHQRCWDDLYRELHEADGSLRCPQTLVIAPDGEVALRVNTGNPPEPDQLVGALQEVVLKAGPGLTDAQLAEVQKLSAEGTTLSDSKSWPDAVRTWQRLLAIAPKGRYAELAHQALPAALKGLSADFERLAALLVPGQAAEGYRRLLEFQKGCTGLAIEKDVVARLRKAEADKTIAAEIAAWKLDVEAAAILAEAQKAADAGDEKKAQRTVRKLFTKKYASTSACATARKLWPEIAAEEDAKGAK
ncbi:MAG: hypothetical protein IPJ77_12400 [Planctomycetes bacterium]|nr:hypothetical protein [Planctomycetota bacterium]